MTSFVLDNSVVMRWCFETAAHPYADSVLNRLATGDTAIVPVLWFYEASAALSRAQNTGALAAAKAADGKVFRRVLIPDLRTMRRSLVDDTQNTAYATADCRRIPSREQIYKM